MTGGILESGFVCQINVVFRAQAVISHLDITFWAYSSGV